MLPKILVRRHNMYAGAVLIVPFDALWDTITKNIRLEWSGFTLQ